MTTGSTSSGERADIGIVVIAGYSLVDAGERDDRVAAFRDMVLRARAADGCRYFAVTADSVDPERINVVEVWRDEKAWKGWRRRARGPRVATPRQVEMRRYDAVGGDRPL